MTQGLPAIARRAKAGPKALGLLSIDWASAASRVGLSARDGQPVQHQRLTCYPFGQMSPTVLRVGRYRFFFFSNEGFEPPHVHVQDGSSLAKFWLAPLELASSTGFASQELTEVRALVGGHRDELLEAWHEFFGS